VNYKNIPVFLKKVKSNHFRRIGSEYADFGKIKNQRVLTINGYHP